MRVEACKPGAKVLYSPIIGGPKRFSGIVREEPWQLGHGAWVTHLTDMDPEYATYVGVPGKKVVRAALVIESLDLAP